MLKALLKEPLLHFLLLSLLIFAVHGQLGGNADESPGEIIVSAHRIEQMSVLFAKTWHRPPTSQELKGLVDDYVKEEILVRQALALGLERDDSVVRRRLRQKMEFVASADAEALQPTPAQLQGYLAAHPEEFRRDGSVAFQQIFFDPAKHGDRIEQEVATVKKSLASDAAADPASLGDPTLLPLELPLADSASVDRTFGGEFASELEKAPLNQWAGPVASGFGLHLVRVTQREAGATAGLEEVRDAVAREWMLAQRKQMEDQRLAEWLKGYTVTIQEPAIADPAR